MFLSSVPEEAIKRIRGELKQLYSFFSKGVHGEYFITTVMPDQETFHQKAARVLTLLYQLALAANFIPDFKDRIPPKLAARLFVNGMEKING